MVSDKEERKLLTLLGKYGLFDQDATFSAAACSVILLLVSSEKSEIISQTIPLFVLTCVFSFLTNHLKYQHFHPYVTHLSISFLIQTLVI